MKVLLVANVAKEHVNKFHIPTIKYLQSKGWQVDVACSVDAEVPAGDHIYNMCWRRSPFTFKTFQGIRDLKKLIAKNHYDIIYCHTPVGGLVARLASRAARKKGTKVVYCAHGLHFFTGAPLINWLMFYPIEKMLAFFTDMFITINPEDCERVQRSFNPNMEVTLIPGIGVNFNRLNIGNRVSAREEYRQKLNIPMDAEVMVYVAEVLKNKNQQMLIKTLAELRRKGRNSYLILAGPVHDDTHIREVIDQLNVQEYVKVLGWRSDIGELMAASDLCVASSIREGFGINLVEAQYCHLPVIAVSNRGHRAIIEDGENGYLVPLNDYKTMAERVEDVMSNSDVYNRFANVDVSKYESRIIAERIYGLLKSI